MMLKIKISGTNLHTNKHTSKSINISKVNYFVISINIICEQHNILSQ